MNYKERKEKMMIDIGDRLREIRKKRHLSRKKFADSLDISKTAYSKYEHGDREIPVSVLYEISQDNNVSLDFLVTGADSSDKIVGDALNNVPSYYKILIAKFAKASIKSAISFIDKGLRIYFNLFI